MSAADSSLCSRGASPFEMGKCFCQFSPGCFGSNHPPNALPRDVGGGVLSRRPGTPLGRKTGSRVCVRVCSHFPLPPWSIWIKRSAFLRMAGVARARGPCNNGQTESPAKLNVTASPQEQNTEHRTSLFPLSTAQTGASSEETRKTRVQHPRVSHPGHSRRPETHNSNAGLSRAILIWRNEERSAMLHHAPMHPTCGGPGVQSTPPHLACPTSCSPNTNRGGVLMGKSLENLASELGVWVLGDSSEAGEFGVEEDWAFVALCSCYFCHRLPSPVPVPVA